MTPRKSSSSEIHARALLVCLTISTWTARRYDKAVTQKVNKEHKASSDAGRYNKFLLPGECASYRELLTIASGLRAAHYTHTLAWSDEGWRLLPTANYMQYADWFRQQQRAFANALETFVRDYPLLREQARTLLGTLYKDEDYPSIADVRKRFALAVAYTPVPAQGDVRCDLAADQIAAIEKDINARVSQAVTIAVRDAWQRLYDVVAKISERLNDPKAIFRDSLIGNAKELVDTLQRLNVTNDPELERMRQRVATELATADPDELRDDSKPARKHRKAVAAKADDILRQMSGLFEVA